MEIIVRNCKKILNDTNTEPLPPPVPQEYLKMPLEELVKLQAEHTSEAAKIGTIINYKEEESPQQDGKNIV